MFEIKHGEIYFAELSFSENKVIGGKRPVLVLQNDIANKNSSNLIVAPITSNITRTTLPTHIQIELNGRQAIILTEQLRVIDKNQLKDKIGQLTTAENENLNNALATLFEINRPNNMVQNESLIKSDPYGQVSKDSWAIMNDIYKKMCEFDELKANVNTIIEKQKIAKGKLGEFSVVDYFKHLGYEANRAGTELDQLKIDVIATNMFSKVYIQVKTGQTSNKEIAKLVKCVCELPDSYVDVKLKKVVCMCADDYPADSEVIRQKLEAQYGLPIMLIHKYQVLKTCPEFKSTIS